VIKTGTVVTSSTPPQADKKIDPNVLFGKDSTSVLSHVFEVTDLHNYVIVEAFGLGANDKLLIESVAGEGSGQFFNYTGNYLAAEFEEMHVFKLIGRYRLRYQGKTPLGAFYVEKRESWKNGR
jgi:hypothetical protein